MPKNLEMLDHTIGQLQLPIKMKFVIKAVEGKARAAILKTPHGTVKTPVFIPCATQATVKALTPKQLKELKCQIVICNTYHLYLRPGPKQIEKFGGLHKFMAWEKPIMTDSGGFQAFSLGAALEHCVGKIIPFFPEEQNFNQKKLKPNKSRVKIFEEGIVFESAKQILTPELSIKIQQQLGADIILALDECTSPLANYSYTKAAMERTHRWAVRSLKAYGNTNNQAIFGIIQGGEWKDLREASAKFISSLPFDGICIGGSLGKSKSDMLNILDWIYPYLPNEKPRHLLGIAAIEDIFEAVSKGIDVFDCILPTRLARVGYAFVRPESGGSRKNKWRIRIISSKYKEENKPIDPRCQCYTCNNFSIGYLRHLFKCKELLAYTLVTYHNLFFYMRLMEEIRKAIFDKRFEKLKNFWLKTN